MNKRLFYLLCIWKKTHKIEDAAKVKTEMIREYLQYIKERGKYTVVGKEHSRSHNFPEL